MQLALAIARKILQREAELDPTLLTALVRIALEADAVRICGSYPGCDRGCRTLAEMWRCERRSSHDGRSLRIRR